MPDLTETFGFAHLLLHVIVVICSYSKVNEENLGKERMISIALSNNWEYSLILHQNATNKPF